MAYDTVFDDNVLGLADRQATMAETGSSAMSDTVRTLQLGFQLEKSFGCQQLSADLLSSQVNYDRYVQFDYVGRDLMAAWKVYTQPDVI